MSKVKLIEKEIDLNENNIRHLITVTFRLAAGVLTLLVSREFKPEGWYFFELIGFILVLLFGLIIIGYIQQRKVLFHKFESEIKKKEK